MNKGVALDFIKQLKNKLDETFIQWSKCPNSGPQKNTALLKKKKKREKIQLLL